MTAKQVTGSLFWRFRTATHLMIPRFTPNHWWECDLWRLMENGLWSEYEIKLSVADFRNDFTKEQEVFRSVEDFRLRTRETEKKHDLLAQRDHRGPNRFWFVVASDIAPKIEVPEYAGKIVATGRLFRPALHIEKQAPMLHREKWKGDPSKLAMTFYWRFWSTESKAV